MFKSCSHFFKFFDIDPSFTQGMGMMIVEAMAVDTIEAIDLFNSIVEQSKVIYSMTLASLISFHMMLVMNTMFHLL